ncbi:mitochondrial DNA replication protein [Neofusicoccum parvum]|nr:mitochondrial DNA replication protein [Neofusicoccum parvum]
MSKTQHASNTLQVVQKKKITWGNLLIGAGMNIFQVTTLGQPLENIKTYVSANRNAPLSSAVRHLWTRGRIAGLYQGLIPWAWLEASTKGAILILTASEIDHRARHSLALSPTAAATLGGVAGGAAQAYLVMGVTTCMKTVEVTRSKTAAAGREVPGTLATFARIVRGQGVRGVTRGVNAVALRQVSGWASRMGGARAAEAPIRRVRGKGPGERLGVAERVGAAVVGGAVSCWNQPFEVIRVDMQAVKGTEAVGRPTMLSTARLIWRENGVRGFFRGVVPRIGVAAWATVCMVGLGDVVRESFGSK